MTLFWSIIQLFELEVIPTVPIPVTVALFTLPPDGVQDNVMVPLDNDSERVPKPEETPDMLNTCGAVYAIIYDP